MEGATHDEGMAKLSKQGATFNAGGQSTEFDLSLTSERDLWCGGKKECVSAGKRRQQRVKRQVGEVPPDEDEQTIVARQGSGCSNGSKTTRVFWT